MRVIWTRSAERDLDGIWDHIEADNPDAAARVTDRVRTSVARLADHPHRGRPGRVFGTRELVIPRLPYVVVYKVEEQRIAILRVIHGAMRWPR